MRRGISDAFPRWTWLKAAHSRADPDSMTYALIGYLAFALASLVVGTRLTLLGARRQALPELSLGLGFVLSGSLGFLLALVPLLAPGLGAEAHGRFRLAGQFVMNTGFVGLYLFNVVVFGGGSRLAATAAWLGGALLTVAFLGGLVSGPATFATLESPFYWCNFIGRTGAFVWAMASGFHHYRLHRKRLELGLTDRTVVNRFLLWALYGLFAVGIMLFGVLTTVTGGPDVRPPLLVSLGLSACGIACAATMALAFFPPESYLRRVRGAAPGAAG